MKLEPQSFLSATFIILICVLQPAMAEEMSVKAGVVLPLSGDFRVLGQEVQRGIELALPAVGKEGCNFEIIYEDDQSLIPKVAAAAAHKLTAVDKVDVGLTMIVEEARPMIPVFIKKKTPLLLVWDSNNTIKNNSDYLFSNGFSTEKAGQDMADYAFGKLKLKTVVIAGHTDPWAFIITEAFRGRFESLGGKIIFEEQFEPAETNYKNILFRIKKANPDGVYFPMIPPNSVQFMKQVRQFEIESTLMTGDPLIQDVIKEAGIAAEGVYYTNFYTEKHNDYAQAYRDRYKSEILDSSMVSVGYEGIELLCKAAKEGETLKEGLINMLGKDHTADRRERVYRIKNGKADWQK